MNESVKAFIDAAKADPDLRERLPKLSVEELIAEAKAKGFELTEADLKPPAGEVGDAELGNVAGGGFCVCPGPGAGGGTDATDGNTYVCVCTNYGQGGDGRLSDANCMCILGGAGMDDGDFM